MWQDRPHLRFAAVCVSMLGGLVWILYLFVNSPGVPVHDELQHYYLCHDSWQTPSLILDAWGRTVNTLVYMPGSFYGLAWARVTSILMACLTAILALALARKLDVEYAFLVPLFLWFQPWYADLSYACITEVPFSLILAAGLLLLLSDRPVPASFVLGLLPLVRHEGILLTGLCVVYCLFKRNWRAGAAALAPMLIYNIAFFWVIGKWAFVELYFRTKPTELYGSGTWSHMIAPLVMGVGLPVFFLAANAFPPILKSRRRLLAFSFYFTYLAAHVVVYRLGLFGSGGYVLFLLPLAPGVAVAAALGLQFIVTQATVLLEAKGVPGRKLAPGAHAFVTVCVAGVLMVAFDTKPRPLDLEGVLMEQTARYLREQALDRNKILCNHVWLHFFMPESTERPYPRIQPAEAPSGTIVVWDAHYSPRFGWDAGKMYENRRDWTLLKVFGEGRVVVFQKRTDGRLEPPRR